MTWKVASKRFVKGKEKLDEKFWRRFGFTKWSAPHSSYVLGNISKRIKLKTLIIVRLLKAHVYFSFVE